jgi:hypothetical protein
MVRGTAVMERLLHEKRQDNRKRTAGSRNLEMGVIAGVKK